MCHQSHKPADSEALRLTFRKDGEKRVVDEVVGHDCELADRHNCYRIARGGTKLQRTVTNEVVSQTLGNMSALS